MQFRQDGPSDAIFPLLEEHVGQGDKEHGDGDYGCQVSQMSMTLWSRGSGAMGKWAGVWYDRSAPMTTLNTHN